MDRDQGTASSLVLSFGLEFLRGFDRAIDDGLDLIRVRWPSRFSRRSVGARAEQRGYPHKQENEPSNAARSLVPRLSVPARRYRFSRARVPGIILG